jgi:hypothetical protein
MEKMEIDSTEIVSQANEINSEIPDEKNAELIEAFIDDDGDTAAFYKKAFEKYTVNGIEKFAFSFSWGGFFFSALNLFHRKLYLEGVIWLVCAALLSGISGGFLTIISLFAGAFVNPFLIYKRFKKILAQCNSKNMNYNQKIETMKAMGGTNVLTSIIMGLALLIGIIVFVIVIVRACVD